VKHSLDYALETIFKIVDRDSASTEIIFVNSVEFGHGVPQSDSVNCLNAAWTMNKLDDFFALFVKRALSKIVDPILTEHKKHWQISISVSKSKSILNLHHADNSANTPITDMMESIISFFSESIQVMFNLDGNNKLILKLTDSILKPLCSGIIQDLLLHWLPPNIPTTLDELNAYPTKIGKFCIDFEHKMIELGFTSENSLSIYNQGISKLFMQSFTQRVLSQCRSIITSSEYDYQLIEHRGNEASKCVDFLFSFPECAISKKALDILAVLKQSMALIKDMDPEWYL